MVCLSLLIVAYVQYYGKGKNLNVQMEHIEKDMGRLKKVVVHK